MLKARHRQFWLYQNFLKDSLEDLICDADCARDVSSIVDNEGGLIADENLIELEKILLRCENFWKAQSHESEQLLRKLKGGWRKRNCDWRDLYRRTTHH